MPSQSDFLRLNYRKRAVQRFKRVGMGLVPDYALAPTSGAVADPATAAQRGGDVTFVASIEHEGPPDGVLFQIGSGIAGMLIGFDGGTTMQFLDKSGGGPGGTMTLAPSSGNDEFLLSDGIHTYVWTLQKSAASGNTEGFVWIDGTLCMSGDTNSLNDWASGTWTFGEEGASTLTGASVTGDLTNATIIGNLEVFFDTRPAVLT